MHRCYVSVVGPIVEALRPATIAEVGAGAGRLTHRLVRAPGAAQSAIHAIDPAIGFEREELTTDGRLTLHGSPSSEVLPLLGPLDLVLLDGDPNWVSVTQDLKAVAATAREADMAPPVVVAHNVHWPFGRRDG